VRSIRARGDAAVVTHVVTQFSEIL